MRWEEEQQFYVFKAGHNSDNSCNQGEAQLVPVNPSNHVTLQCIKTGFEKRWRISVSDGHHRAGAFSPASVLAAIKAAPRRRDGLVNDDGSPDGRRIKESNMYVGVMKTSQKLCLNWCLLPSSGTCRIRHRTSAKTNTLTWTSILR